MKHVLKIAAVGLLFFTSAVFAQVPVATQVAILRAEDSRDYDGLKPFIFSRNLAVQKRAVLAAGRIGAGGKHRAHVEAAVREVCEFKGFGLSALNVRTNHVHSVVSAQSKPEQIATAFKAYSTRRFRAENLVGPEQKNTVSRRKYAILVEGAVC
ncbi:MAG: transposase [Blastocatellia bacterium]